MVAQSSERYSITVPKSLVKLKDWRKGHNLLVGLNSEGTVEVREIEKVSPP